MTSSAPSTAAPRAGADGDAGAARGARYALIVLALLWPAQLLSLIGMLTGNAQAKVALHFHTTQIQWFLLSSALVGTAIAPFVIKAADLYGKHQVMIVITVLGLIGDVIAAAAPSYGVMLAGRAIAGFYAPIAALAYAAVREVLPPKKAVAASSIMGSGIALVALGGPFLTGWLLDSFGFRGVLWAMATATAISLVLLVGFLPGTDYRDPEARMDWIGGTLLGGGLAALTFGIGKGTEWGWTNASTLGFIIGGLIALVLFVISQNVVKHPFVHLAMLKRRPVWTVVMATALTGGAVFGAAVISQLLALYPKVVVPYPIPGGNGATTMVHMSDGLGWSATHNAIVGIPASITILALGFGTGIAVRKIDSRLPYRLGALLVAIGFALQASFHHNATQLIAASFGYALGFGMIVAVGPVLVIEAVAPEEQALASGVQNMAMGVVTTLVTTLCYVVLSHHQMVLQGTALYLDQGYKDAFYFGAAVAAVGLLAALLIPRLKRVSELQG
ncbi:MAG: MFS transporter [Catenulispora sp.]|nr:MFS transporter [Catenulispora sp.]